MAWNTMSPLGVTRTPWVSREDWELGYTLAYADIYPREIGKPWTNYVQELQPFWRKKMTDNMSQVPKPYKLRAHRMGRCPTFGADIVFRKAIGGVGRDRDTQQGTPRDWEEYKFRYLCRDRWCPHCYNRRLVAPLQRMLAPDDRWKVAGVTWMTFPYAVGMKKEVKARMTRYWRELNRHLQGPTLTAVQWDLHPEVGYYLVAMTLFVGYRLPPRWEPEAKWKWTGEPSQLVTAGVLEKFKRSPGMAKADPAVWWALEAETTGITCVNADKTWFTPVPEETD